VRNVTPAGVPFVNSLYLPLDRAAWARDYGAARAAWYVQLRQVAQLHRLPAALLHFLNLNVMLQSQMVARFDQLLEHTCPAAIVTDYDRDTSHAPLVLVARGRGIPTLTMVHGVVSPPSVGYAPLLADVALCWGQQHVDQFVAMHTAPERLQITGCQRIDTTLNADTASARQRLNVVAEGSLFMLATNPIRVDQRQKMATAFCEAITHTDGVAGFVRLHPSENRATYQAQIERYPQIPFTTKDDFTVDEAIGMSHAVVCHNTGLAAEALLKGRLVAIFDGLDVPLGNAANLIERAKCPTASDAKQLRQVMERMAHDAGYQAVLWQAAQQFIAYQYAALGDAATQRVVQVIRQVIEVDPK